MLRKLKVKNFALMGDLDISFEEGLNVITGETGAGKSLLVEAVGFLLGARATQEWVRSGESLATVEGVLEGKKGSLTLRRELEIGGRSRAWVNGTPVSISRLAELGQDWVDFHGQHENQTLFKPVLQLELLDSFGEMGSLRKKTSALYVQYQDVKKRLESRHLSEQERLKLLDLYRFQLQEIREASLKPGEEEELEALIPRLKNSEKLRTVLSQAYEVLYEGERSLQERFLKAQRLFADISKLDPSFGPASGKLDEAYVRAEEAVEEVRRLLKSIEEVPENLDEIYSRQDLLMRLKKKYGPTLEAVAERAARLEKEVEGLENFEEDKAALEEKLGAALELFGEAASELHRLRLAAAKRLSAQVLKEIRDLGMPSARFTVSVEMDEENPTERGFDSAEFMISSNPGEPLRPLRAIASGGELSRVMLALKTVLASADKIPVLIFDEVDSGVGGVVARSVGEKLAQLAQSHQVLCVTHLPQIACYAPTHYKAVKEVRSGRTYTLFSGLKSKDRLSEIARMLAGREATAASLRHAEELLEEVHGR